MGGVLREDLVYPFGQAAAEPQDEIASPLSLLQFDSALGTYLQIYPPAVIVIVALAIYGVGSFYRAGKADALALSSAQLMSLS